MISDITISHVLYPDHIITKVQKRVDTNPSRRNSRHYGGEFSRSDFSNKRIKREELNTEPSAVQWESLVSGSTPE